MNLRAPSRRSSFATLGLIAGVVGCLDLAHTNPFDPGTPIDIAVTGPDSAYSLQQIIGFSFTSDPEWPGVVAWKSSNEGLLHSLQDGRFGVVGAAAPPNDTASVMVLLGTHVATHRVVVRQRLVAFTFACFAATSPCVYSAGKRDASIIVAGRDANGFPIAVPFVLQLQSTRPNVLRIDGNPGGPETAFTLPVSPLTPGTSFVIASSAGFRDSVLVTVR
jgi:hypothetical protein